MQDAVVNINRIATMSHYITGEPAPRRGNSIPNAVPSRLYCCKPGGPNDYVYIHTATPQMWNAVLTTIGRADLIGDPRFQTQQGRNEHAEEIYAMIEAWTLTRSKHEVRPAARSPCPVPLCSCQLRQPNIRRHLCWASIQTKFYPPGSATTPPNWSSYVPRALCRQLAHRCWVTAISVSSRSTRGFEG
jgi:crotonobetainyl-CoA:carnitine CoA-transferase CaiB-like acyl-CoA transferase